MSLRTDNTGFGEIKLLQDTEQFCYGVDAVLLADFCRAEKGDNVCELGSGNGAVSLIAWAKYHPAHMTGVELQKEPYALSVKSAALNGLDDNIEFVNCDIKDFAPEHKAAYDLVISNPPYFAKGRGLTKEADALSLARHESTAGLDDFMKAASMLLKFRGRFCMVHRPFRLADIMCSARSAGLEPKIMRFVSPGPSESPNLVLLELVKGAGSELKVLPGLILRNADGSYTDELLAIYNK